MIIWKKVQKMVSKTLASLFLSAIFASSIVQASSVFKISKGQDSIYIGGTFHLLTEKDYPLPAEFDEAYEKADELYFETNMQEIETPEFQQKSLKVILYQDGKTLQTDLNESTYARFVKYAKSRQIDPMQLNVFNPTGVMLTITIMEYQARGFVAEGVDKHYFNRASGDSKKISWFESPDEQLAILDGFDSEDPNGLINYTLDEMDNIDNLIENLHKSWRTGNMEMLEQLGIDSFKNYPEVYNSVLVERNNKWIQVIETMFNDKDTEFILVGALHLPGAAGVLTQLEKKGYKVEKL